MTRVRFGLTFLMLLLCAGLAFSYTAVLKNGKKIEGEFVREDDTHIWIKDSEGVELTIRKSTLDADATLRLNPASKSNIPNPEEQTTAPRQPSETPLQEKSLGQIARENRAKRTGAGRVLKKEDLSHLPEITILGQEQTDFPETEKTILGSLEEARAEKAWKDAALKIYQRLEQAQQQYDSLRKECEQLSMASSFAMAFVLQGGAVLGSPVMAQAEEVCARSDEAKEELLSVEKEFDAFQEDARKKGILPGWTDPLRLE